ncbi:hypothetical protein [Fontivita pretiosa]|uniref:hypothetical protein n=1 Tax=Fontivita pretiosa TaxID=2989684 RepID=UPI003D17463D
MPTGAFKQAFEDQTTLHPVALAVLILLSALMLVVPRRYAVWPLVALACFIAPAQRIVIFSADFSFLRIMVIVGMIRVMLKNEWSGITWRLLDFLLIAWAAVGTVAYTVQHAELSALINRMGRNFEGIGLYLLLRFLIRDWRDLESAVTALILASIPVVFCMLIEKSTARNLFAVLGGVPEFTLVREGRVRCQGPFPHPIIAGCFFGTLVPLLVAGAWRRGRRLISLIGTGSFLSAVVLSASSTPVMSVIFGVVGACFFFLRHYMRLVRWGMLLLLIALHLSMRHPVWHLIARIDISGGSTGWHRYLLIQQTIDHFEEWWLVGTNDTGHWADGLGDVTNQFILEAVTGGMLTLALFVAVVVVAFAQSGRLWRLAGNDRRGVVLGWALGVTMFVHTMNFIAVSYFGQINLVWYLTLAAIGTLSSAPAVACAATTAARERRAWSDAPALAAGGIIHVSARPQQRRPPRPPRQSTGPANSPADLDDALLLSESNNGGRAFSSIRS